MAASALDRQREIWRKKPVLRAIYNDFFDRIAATVVPGATLEIGAGIGTLKERLRAAAPAMPLVASDIRFSPWLDCVADAQRLPFAAASFSNIVMVDVCHHLEFPLRFFREAARVLDVGGRIVMVEPAITWASSLPYRLLHREPVHMVADPLADGVPDPLRDPNDANQAIATLIATRDFSRFHAEFPALAITRVDWFSLAVYPLSGGFERWSLVPTRFAARGLRLEQRVEPRLGRLLGFRMMMTIDKAS